MKSLSAFLLSLVGIQVVMASPFLSYCNLSGYLNLTINGFFLYAQCGEDNNTMTCQQLNLVHCFANWDGKLWPSMHTLGMFNNTCGDCSVITSKNDTEKYGNLVCECEGPDVTNHTTYALDAIVRYESVFGMMCSYGNDSVVRSYQCPQATNERQVRRSLQDSR